MTEAPPKPHEEQMVLPLRWRAAQGQKDFFVSDANSEAVAFLDGWSTWPVPAALPPPVPEVQEEQLQESPGPEGGA